MALISAFIITYNHEWSIRRAIKSLKNIADEIIVVDGGSTDSTVVLAKQLGVKVLHNSWEGGLQQKIIAEEACKHQWILNLNANEELLAELQAEIGYIFSNDYQDRYKVYSIKLVAMSRFSYSPSNWSYSKTQIRLYNRAFASFNNSRDYNNVTFIPNIKRSEVYKLCNIAIYRSAISLDSLVSQINFLSSEQAKDLIDIGYCPSKLRIFTEFFIVLFKMFILRRYFLFGISGFIDSCIFAFAGFLKVVKVYDYYMHNPRNRRTRKIISKEE